MQPDNRIAGGNVNKTEPFCDVRPITRLFATSPPKAHQCERHNQCEQNPVEPGGSRRHGHAGRKPQVLSWSVMSDTGGQLSRCPKVSRKPRPKPPARAGSVSVKMATVGTSRAHAI